MLVASNITMQFGAKPLFDNVSVKFGEGNRYGLNGANGAGKSTFMKILCGVLEPSGGNVSKDPHERMAYLRQDQFAYEDMRVLDVVMMGHAEMWAVMQEKDAIYANPEATEEDYMKAAELEGRFAEFDGYTAESRAGELLLGVGIPVEQHDRPMREVAPGWKLRVLLCQALFANPDILLLDEPTNNLDINTIRWLEEVLNERDSTMIIISHDRHFLNQVCTHMADMDYGTLKIYPGNYDDYMLASAQARTQQLAANAKAKEKIAELQDFVRRFSANKSKARQATSRARQIDKIKVEDVKPSSRQNPFIRFEGEKKLHRLAVEAQGLSKAYDRPLFNNLSIAVEAGEKIAIIGENGAGKTTLLRCLSGHLPASGGKVRYAMRDGRTVALDEMSEAERRLLMRTDWGFVHQDAREGLRMGVSAGANVGERMMAVGARHYGHIRQTAVDWLKRVEVPEDRIDDSPWSYSGGMRQRLQIARNLVTSPRLVFMDEPTGRLDVSVQARLLDLIRGLVKRLDLAAIIVTHDLAVARLLSTRMMVMQQGEVIEQGLTDQVLEDPQAPYTQLLVSSVLQV